MIFSSIFFWSALGASFVLCTAFLNQYIERPGRTIEFVFGSSLLIALGLSSAMTVVARRFAYPRLLGGMTAGTYPFSALNNEFSTLSREMRLNNVELHKAIFGDAFSIKSKGRGIVAVSPELVDSLSPEETQAVLAHELSHLRNHDSLVKGLARLARLAFPFDPIVRLVEAAVHRERELFADRVAVLHTKKPLSLASALIHVHSIPRSPLPGQGAGFFVGGKHKGLLSLSPDLDRRIGLLLEMDKVLTRGVSGSGRRVIYP